MAGLGNAVRIVVETTEGDIFTREFQQLLKQVNDFSAVRCQSLRGEIYMDTECAVDRGY